MDAQRDGESTLTGGRLRGAISTAITRVMHEFYGKGSERAKSFMFDNYVLVVLEDVLTTAELSLKQAGDTDLIRDVRLAFEDMMTATFVGEVERLTGRRVVAYHSQVVFDPDVAFEFFVLEPKQAGDRSLTDPDVEDAAAEAPGQVGDADRLPGIDESTMRHPDVSREGTSRGSGNVRAALSNAMVRLLREQHGKGPSRAKTYLADDYVLCAAEDPLTTVERTLVEGDEPALVRRLRLRLQDRTAHAYSREVESITGRRVDACHCQIVFDPDVLFLVFALSPEDGAGTPALTEPDVERLDA